MTEQYTLSSVMPASKPPRPGWVVPIVVALGVLLIAAGGAIVYLVAMRPAATAPAAATVTAKGIVSVDDGDITRFNGDPCSIKGRYSDIAEGASVVVTDSVGKTVAIGRLGPGHGAVGTNDCVFDFAVDVPAGLQFYGFEVNQRGRVQFTEADLARPVELTLGH